MLLLLVRHAESMNNVLIAQIRAKLGDDFAAVYEQQKSDDPDISELGHAQAARIARCLPDFIASVPVPAGARVRLCSSPMRRARATAEHIAGVMQTPIDLVSDIHEVKGCWSGSKGSAPGLGREALLRDHCLVPGDQAEEQASSQAVQYRNSTDAPVPEAGWWTVEGQTKDKESVQDSCKRALGVARRLRQQAADSAVPLVVIMVTHGNFVCLLTQALLGIPMDMSQLKLDNTAASFFLLSAQSADSPVVCVHLNRSEHLDLPPAIKRTRQNIRFAGFDKDGHRISKPATKETPAKAANGTTPTEANGTTPAKTEATTPAKTEATTPAL